MPDSTPPNSPLIQRGPGSFLIGASYPLRALKLLIEMPRLRRYVLLPILLNLVIGLTLYAGLLTTGLQAIDAFLAAVPVWLAQTPHLEIDWSSWWSTMWSTVWSTAIAALPHWSLPSLPPIALPNWWPSLPALHWPTISLPNIVPEWLPPLPDLPPLPKFVLPSWFVNLSSVGLGILIWFLRLLLVLTLLLVTGFILLQFGVLLGAPWYGQLSEELEKLKTGQLQTVHISPVREIWRAVLYELKKLVLTVGVGIPLLICHFFPGAGTLVATTGGITLAATIVCLDFLDAVLERRRLSFRQKLGAVQQALPASAGFGLVCLALVSIPFFNLLAIPVCVAAGTLFACDRVLPWLQIERQK
jgi:CysZ protein